MPKRAAGGGVLYAQARFLDESSGNLAQYFGTQVAQTGQYSSCVPGLIFMVKAMRCKGMPSSYVSVAHLLAQESSCLLFGERRRG
jgi:hypothetical protein